MNQRSPLPAYSALDQPLKQVLGCGTDLGLRLLEPRHMFVAVSIRADRPRSHTARQVNRVCVTQGTGQIGNGAACNVVSSRVKPFSPSTVVMTWSNGPGERTSTWIDAPSGTDQRRNHPDPSCIEQTGREIRPDKRVIARAAEEMRQPQDRLSCENRLPACGKAP
jgi:hypothetical protein